MRVYGRKELYGTGLQVFFGRSMNEERLIKVRRIGIISVINVLFMPMVPHGAERKLCADGVAYPDRT